MKTKISLKTLLPLLAAFIILLPLRSHAFGPVTDLTDNYLTLSDGQVMHYYDEGNPKGKPLLMVHGYPASAYLYRGIIKELCPTRFGEYRCLAMTHIGFGKSSCPGDGTSVGPMYEVEKLEEFILALDLQDYAAVVHDWGGPIGTLASLRHHERLSHLIVLNTMLTFPEEELLAKVMDTAETFFATDRPFIEYVYDGIVAAAMQVLTNSKLPRDVLDEYREPFEGNMGACRTHAGINLFAKAHSDEELFAEIEEKVKDHWQEKPARLFWGLDDPLFGNRTSTGIEVHERIEALLPQADTVVFDASHFMQEDQPENIAAEIRNFVPGY